MSTTNNGSTNGAAGGGSNGSGMMVVVKEEPMDAGYEVADSQPTNMVINAGASVLGNGLVGMVEAKEELVDDGYETAANRSGMAALTGSNNGSNEIVDAEEDLVDDGYKVAANRAGMSAASGLGNGSNAIAKVNKPIERGPFIHNGNNPIAQGVRFNAFLQRIEDEDEEDEEEGKLIIKKFSVRQGERFDIRFGDWKLMHPDEIETSDSDEDDEDDATSESSFGGRSRQLPTKRVYWKRVRSNKTYSGRNRRSTEVRSGEWRMVDPADLEREDAKRKRNVKKEESTIAQASSGQRRQRPQLKTQPVVWKLVGSTELGMEDLDEDSSDDSDEDDSEGSDEEEEEEEEEDLEDSDESDEDDETKFDRNEVPQKVFPAVVSTNYVVGEKKNNGSSLMVKKEVMENEEHNDKGNELVAQNVLVKKPTVKCVGVKRSTNDTEKEQQKKRFK